MCHGSNSRVNAPVVGNLGIRWRIFGAKKDRYGKTPREDLGEVRAETLVDAEIAAHRRFVGYGGFVVIASASWEVMSREQRGVVLMRVDTVPPPEVEPEPVRRTMRKLPQRKPCASGCGRMTAFKWCRHCPPSHPAARGQWRLAIARRDREAASLDRRTKKGKTRLKEIALDCG